MFPSIRWRLITSYILLTLFTVTSVGLLAMWAVRQYARQQEVKSLTANAEAIAQQAFPLLWPDPAIEEINQLANAASFFGNVRVRILDSRQRVLADSGDPSAQEEMILLMLPEGNDIPGREQLESWILGLPSARSPLRPGILDQPEIWLSLLDELPPGTSSTVIRRVYGPWGNRFSFEAAEGEPQPEIEAALAESAGPRSGNTVLIPVSESGRLAGYVELSGGTDFGAEALVTTRRSFLLAGVGAVVLAALLGWVMGKRIIAPLTSLTAAANEMSAGDLSVRAPVTGKDEIGRLAAQFNQMAEKLQTSFSQVAAERDSLRRFIADASHELRTPITALKNFNDLLQGAAADDPDAQAEFLVESQAQIERLEWITQNLLDLSRLDAGVAALDIASHDLQEILDSAAAPFKTRAGEHGVTLEIHAPPVGTEISCDRARLEIALSNLLDNALKYTPEDGVIEIGGEPAEAGLRLWVCDSGPGIDPVDLPNIFERFYRGQNSTVKGSGLGLSIVRSVVQAHGGRVSVESSPGEGACFTILWPGT